VLLQEHQKRGERTTTPARAASRRNGEWKRSKGRGAEKRRRPQGSAYLAVGGGGFAGAGVHGGGREGCGGDWGRRERLASHLTAARLGPRTSGASDVLWLRERDDDDETTGSREPGERAGTIEGRARGDLPCGKSPVRRGEDRGGVATVDLSRREERLLTKKKTRGETFCSRIWGNGEMKRLPRAGGNLVREIFRKPSGKLKIGLKSSFFSWHT
jgi:hypothetical protein